MQVPFISLVNLIQNKAVVSELIQEDFNKQRLIAEVDKLLNKRNKQILLDEYQHLAEKLGQRGASDRAAKAIHDLLIK